MDDCLHLRGKATIPVKFISKKKKKKKKDLIQRSVMRSGHSEASQNLGVRIQYQSVYTIGISLWRTKLKFQSTNQQKVEEPGFIFNSYQNGM